MKKKLISIGMVIVLLLLMQPMTFANVETHKSYKEIIDSTMNTYGAFEENINFYATGLIYGEFIDFDNDNTKEMLLIYKKKNDSSYDAPWANIVIYGMKGNTPIKLLEEGIYSSLGQTDMSYQILIRDINGQKHLLFNSKKTPVSHGDSENITMFTMNNKNIEIKKYYGEVLPWWDTYEFKYTKCMIDSKPVSEEEYTGDLYSFYNNSQRINLFLGKDFDNFSFCSKEKLNKFLEEAKDISNTQNTTIAGTLSERYIKDSSGKDVQCLILTLDTPQNFQATDMFGETFTATDVREVQVIAKNYVSDMDGAKVKIASYGEIFEGHTAYHIRPIVINSAVIEIVEKAIKVTLDGKKIIFDQPPIIVDGRTLVPLRAIFEELGATVNWDGNTQTVTSTKGQTTISMAIGKTEMYKNGKLITLDVVPQLVGGRTLVPVRAVAEGFDCKVDWDGDNQTVIIKTIDTEKVIKAAKNLYQANEDMGGVTNLATYAEVDALLYNYLMKLIKH